MRLIWWILGLALLLVGGYGLYCWYQAKTSAAPLKVQEGESGKDVAERMRKAMADSTGQAVTLRDMGNDTFVISVPKEVGACA